MRVAYLLEKEESRMERVENTVEMVAAWEGAWLSEKEQSESSVVEKKK